MLKRKKERERDSCCCFSFPQNRASNRSDRPNDPSIEPNSTNEKLQVNSSWSIGTTEIIKKYILLYTEQKKRKKRTSKRLPTGARPPVSFQQYIFKKKHTHTRDTTECFVHCLFPPSHIIGTSRIYIYIYIYICTHYYIYRENGQYIYHIYVQKKTKIEVNVV